MGGTLAMCADPRLFAARFVDGSGPQAHSAEPSAMSCYQLQSVHPAWMLLRFDIRCNWQGVQQYTGHSRPSVSVAHRRSLAESLDATINV